MEGPADKTVTFLAERERLVDIPVPPPPPGLAELAYLGAHTLGALLMFLMQATVCAGVLYRVNPLDQPGVEAGKALARASLAGGGVHAASGHWQV